MARPVQIDTEAVLAAARTVFLERGIQGTTSEVARRAGISEGSVFKHFGSKTQLFHAALTSGGAPEWLARLPSRVGRGSVRAQLRAVAAEGLAFFRQVVPLAMMAWSEPDARSRARSKESGVPRAVHGHRALAEYLESEMAQGRLRKQNAKVAARALLGALWHYAWMELMFGATRAELETEDVLVTHLVNLLLDGLGVESDKPSRSHQRTRA